MEEKPASVEEQKATSPPIEQPETELPTPSLMDKLKTHKFKIIVGVLAALVFASGIFSAYKLGQRQLQPQASPSPEAVVSPSSDPTANWQTYTNTEYGYSIKYPPTFELKEIAGVGVEIDKYKGQEICMKLTWENTSGSIRTGISIASPDIKGKSIMCFRSGVGVEAEDYKEQIEINDISYLAEGVRDYKVEEGDKTYTGETLYVVFKNGFKIEYGGVVSQNEPFEKYLEAKETLFQILSTFRFLGEESPIPSPTTTEKISYKSISTWQTYDDPQAKFSVQYPENYKLSSSNPGKEVVFWSCVDNPEIGELCMSGYTIRIYEDYDGGSRRAWFEKLRPNFLIDPYYEDVYVVGIKALIIMDGNLGGSTGSSVLIPKGNKMFLFDFPNGWNPETKEKPGLDFIKQVLSTFKFLD